MDHTGMKYGFLIYFCREQTFVVKTEGWPLWVLSQKLIFFQILKKIVCITIMSNEEECGQQGIGIRIFSPFSP
jgi:hypothetical protein